MNQYNPNIHHRNSIRLKGYDYSQAGLYFITICIKDSKCLFGDIENDEMILNDFGNIAQNQWIKLSERYHNIELDTFQIMPNHMHGIISINPVRATLAVAHPNMNANVGGGNNDMSANDTRNNYELNANVIGGNYDDAFLNLDKTISNNENTIPNNENTIPNNENTIQNNNKLVSIENTISNNDDLVSIEERAGASPAPTVKHYTIGNIVGAYKSLVALRCLEIFKNNNPDKMMGKLWHRNYYEIIIRDEQTHQRISDYIIDNPKHWKRDWFY